MTRRLAAAVLYAVMIMVSSTDVNGPDDIDDTDDGVTDCADYRDFSDRAGVPGVLATATSICGTPIDHAWIGGQLNHPAGAIAIEKIGSHTVRLNLAVQNSLQVSSHLVFDLLNRALAHCRDTGMLKISIDSEGLNPAALHALARTHGYHFTRTREIDGIQSSEFYLDLYTKPQHA